MTLKNLFSTLTAIALIAIVGCESNGESADSKALFQLETTELTVSADGGSQQVAYTVVNPQENAVVLASCKASWIKAFNTSAEGSISFIVAPNYTSELRETIIEVSYTAIEERFEIAVKQEASTKAMFEIEVVENSPRELVVDITPADTETAYICEMHTKEHIESFGLGDDTQLIANDYAVFADRAADLGQSTLNYLQNISYRGEANGVTFSGLTPNTQYVVYSYYIDLSSGQAASDVYRMEVCTAKPEMLDVSFEMTFDVKGAHIEQNITPSNQSVYYYVGYMGVEDFYTYYGNVDMATTFVAKWNENVAIKLGLGQPASQIIEEYGKIGTQSFSYDELRAETEYLFYVFAISGETAFAASDILLEKVSTKAAEASGMTIDISVKDIYATTANVYWVASDAEGWFARSVFTKAEYDALGANDEQRFASIEAKGYSFYEAQGATDMNLANLQPNTTYVAFAYGLDGETPNTRIFTTEFTTKAAIAGGSDIAITLEAHFNLAEVAEVDPTHWGDFAGREDYALVPVTISGISSTDEVYWMLTTFPIDYYNYDDEWIRDLTTNELYHQKYHSNCYFQLPYETEYSLIAVAKDANGNFGKLLKKEIYLYKSDSADIASYVYIEER